jgi:hypothetical protein
MKTINLKLLISFLLCAAITFVNAQSTMFGTYQTQVYGKITADAYQRIIEKKLIVVLLEEDSYIVNKLAKNKDPEKLATYKKTIKDFNADVKPVFEALWTIHKSIEFKTWSEISEIPKSEKSDYVIVTFMRYQSSEQASSTETFEDVSRIDFDNSIIGGLQKTSDDLSDTREYTVMKFGQLQSIKLSSQAWVIMGHLVPTSVDLAFGIGYIEWYLKSQQAGASLNEMMRESKVTCKEIPNLTLLVNEQDAKDVKIMGDASSKYPYRFQILPIEEIEEIILSKTPGYAYLNFNNNKSCVVKAENNAILFVPYTTALTIQTNVTVAKMGEMVQKNIEEENK